MTIRVILAALALLSAGCEVPDPPGIVFVGDVYLGGSVAREIGATARSPWTHLPARPGDAWVGTFEGALSDDPRSTPCSKDPSLCLGVETVALVALDDGRFRAFSLANNHALDFGEGGRTATAEALGARGILPLTAEASPAFLEVGGQTWALVAVDLTSDARGALERARLQVGLARARTPLVAALVHGGAEGVDAATAGQEAAAAVLRRWGAALVIGSHSHTVQPVRCDPEGATYHGLGNHVFHQPRHAEGRMVRCHVEEGRILCRSTITRRSDRSAFPEVYQDMGDTCEMQPAAPSSHDTCLTHSHADALAFVQPFPGVGAGGCFALRRAFSDMDGEVGIRPYVYRMQGTRAVDLWRGTALGAPLVAARLEGTGTDTVLCALHRGDSLLEPDPTTPIRRVRAWRWNGFGFSGVERSGEAGVCDGI